MFSLMVMPEKFKPNQRILEQNCRNVFFVSESKVGFENKLEKWLSRSLSLNGHKFEAEARQPSYHPRQTFRIKKCQLQFNEEGSFLLKCGIRKNFANGKKLVLKTFCFFN